MSDPRLGSTRTDILDLDQRYEAIWGRTDIGRDKVIEEWYRALRSLPVDALHRALDKVRDTHEGHARPRVGQFKRIAKQIMADDRPEHVRGAEGVCRVCNTRFRYAGYEMPNGTIHPRLRCNCRPPGSGWETPAAKAWRETDPQFLRSRGAA